MASKQKKLYTLENGYENLFRNRLDEAHEIFSNLKTFDPRARWADNLIGLILGNLNEYPTYFQIRNFFEIDLHLLITNYKGDYVESILKYADFLAEINPEVYKYIGRVFINNDLIPQGKAMLLLGKSYFYRDPELHYLLAETYYKEKDFAEAEKALNACLEILPKYFPATKLLKKIKQV